MNRSNTTYFSSRVSVDFWQCQIVKRLRFGAAGICILLLLGVAQAKPLPQEKCIDIRIQTVAKMKQQKQSEEMPFDPVVYSPLAEFFSNGGEGTLFSFERHTELYEEGFYILVQKLPEQIKLNSNSYYLRDSRVMKLLRKLQNENIPFVISHVGRGHAAAVNLTDLFQELKQCGMIDNAPAIIEITDYADSFVIEHELQHYKDQKSGVLDSIQNWVLKMSAENIFDKNEGEWINAVIREQRAYAIEVALAKQSTQEPELYMDDGTIRVVPRSVFLDDKISHKIKYLNKYAEHVSPVLDRLRDSDKKAYEEIRSHLSEYWMPSDEFSLNKIFTLHFN